MGYDSENESGDGTSSESSESSEEEEEEEENDEDNEDTSSESSWDEMDDACTVIFAAASRGYSLQDMRNICSEYSRFVLQYVYCMASGPNYHIPTLKWFNEHGREFGTDWCVGVFDHLQHGAIENNFLLAPMMRGIRFSCIEVVRACLGAGHDVRKEYQDEYGSYQTPLLYALMQGNRRKYLSKPQRDIVKLILEEPNTRHILEKQELRYGGGTTALMLASSRNEAGLVQEMLELGAHPAATDNDGLDALCYAVMNGAFDALKELLAVNRPLRQNFSKALSKIPPEFQEAQDLIKNEACKRIQKAWRATVAKREVFAPGGAVFDILCEKWKNL